MEWLIIGSMMVIGESTLCSCIFAPPGKTWMCSRNLLKKCLLKKKENKSYKQFASCFWLFTSFHLYFVLLQAYQAINIRLVLTALEIQETDLFQRDSHSNTDADYYGAYVENELSKTESFRDLSVDHAFLIRYAKFCCNFALAWEKVKKISLNENFRKRKIISDLCLNTIKVYCEKSQFWKATHTRKSFLILPISCTSSVKEVLIKLCSSL